MSAADAAEIVSLRSLEWVAEWLSVIPYYRKKPIANTSAFLVRAAREGWKPPPAYIAQRNAERIMGRRRELEHDDLRARRPVLVAEPERASPERVRAIGEALRAQFGKRSAMG